MEKKKKQQREEKKLNHWGEMCKMKQVKVQEMTEIEDHFYTSNQRPHGQVDRIFDKTPVVNQIQETDLNQNLFHDYYRAQKEKIDLKTVENLFHTQNEMIDLFVWKETPLQKVRQSYFSGDGVIPQI